MFIKLAKSQNAIIAYVYLAFCAIGFRISVFFTEPVFGFQNSYPSPFSELVVWGIDFFSINDSLIIWIAIFSIYIQAIWINFIVNKHVVLYRKSFLTALLFLLLNCLFVEQLFLTPLLIANFFLIPLLDKLLSVYDTNKPISLSFDVGLLLCIASLFYFPVVVFLILAVIAFIAFTTSQLKQWFSFIIGFGLPIFFMGFYYFWIDDLSGLNTIYQNYEWTFFSMMYDLSVIQLILLGALALLLLLALKSLAQNFHKNAIQVRKYHRFIILYAGISILSMLIFSIPIQLGLVILTIPLSVLLSYYFLIQKKLLIPELLFIAVLGLTVYCQVS
ncbi:MAG: hypothetical protein JKY33_10170 [Bacteroidia bacterium]|nr:hypothetical protein [Bacteroidia bacterium]